MPDSGHDHTTDSNDGFFVITANFDTFIASGKFRMSLRFDQSICNLYKNWLKNSTGNPSGFVCFNHCEGQNPAQETSCLAVGKTDISPPISESTWIAVR